MTNTENIMEDGALEKVDSFKAIVSRGRKREILTTEKHKDLVVQKYCAGAKMKGHVTLFRVPDKSKLAGKEITEHTVPGPVWTPPSSVGFVLGAESKGNRMWMATDPSEYGKGFTMKDGNPAIYAREASLAILSGYIAREPKESEKYGQTKRGPCVVLTPPSARKKADIHDIVN